MQDKKQLLIDAGYKFLYGPEVMTTISRKDDMPWRIKINKKGERVLEQGYRERNWALMKWSVKRKNEDIEDLLWYIIQHHNRSCSYMDTSGWKPIPYVREKSPK